MESRAYGLSLIIGSLFAFITMGLHPAGGNIEAIQHASVMLYGTHILAILSIPFIL